MVSVTHQENSVMIMENKNYYVTLETILASNLSKEQAQEYIRNYRGRDNGLLHIKTDFYTKKNTTNILNGDY